MAASTQGLGRPARTRLAQAGSEPAAEEDTIVLGRQSGETTDQVAPPAETPTKAPTKTTAAKTTEG